MPTGYTVSVQDGTITEFADFAMSCARAFGACVTLRDDPSSTPIPDEFTPSDYNSKALADATAKLAELEALTPIDRIAAADKENAAAQRSWDDREAKRHAQRERYDLMLSKVKDWTPPTPEHDGMKKFMIDQLLLSIDFDCRAYSSPPKAKKTEDWYAESLSKANKDIAYHAKAQDEEIERARGRTKWVNDLRASLLPPKSEAA